MGVPALGTLGRYVIYARPQVMDGVPLGNAAPASPVFGLALTVVLGLMFAAVGIALIIRYR